MFRKNDMFWYFFQIYMIPYIFFIIILFLKGKSQECSDQWLFQQVISSGLWKDNGLCSNIFTPLPNFLMELLLKVVFLFKNVQIVSVNGSLLIRRQLVLYKAIISCMYNINLFRSDNFRFSSQMTIFGLFCFLVPSFY